MGRSLPPSTAVPVPRGRRNRTHSTKGATAMTIAADPEQARDALGQRLFGAALGAFDLMGVYLGDRLGLYRAMAGAPAMRPRELAERAGIAERYAREWLEQQALAGIV